MTRDECGELLQLFMNAAEKMLASHTNDLAKMEMATVRLVTGQSVYVRPLSDMSTPLDPSPTSATDLDDGDIELPNISGETLAQGDAVAIIYRRSYSDGFIARVYR